MLLSCPPPQVTFVPDASVFSPGINFDADTIASRLRELAFLNAGATMQLRLLKHGLPLPVPGSSSKPAQQAAAAADNPKRRSKRTTAQQEAAAAAVEAGTVGSNGVEAAGSSGSSSNGVAAAEQEGWQVFCYQEGLKEYVQW